jgi:hypothetical protein
MANESEWNHFVAITFLYLPIDAVQMFAQLV